jgi:hypothetical protein
MGEGDPDDPRMAAGIAMLGRSGAMSFQLRYDEEQDPIVWVACAEWATRRLAPADPSIEGSVHEAAAAMTPLRAVLRLCERVIDGGVCTHCARPTAFEDDFTRSTDGPLERLFCWYVFDPELKTFRRGCEGDVPRVGRNDPCPCGSGIKFKRCHGSGRAQGEDQPAGPGPAE